MLIILLLVALVGAIYYAGRKVNNESITVTSKVDSFNQNVNDINKNLQNISTQLKNENSKLSGGGSISIP